MTEVTYYFNAKGTDVWSDAAHIIDNILTNYAYTSSDVIQLVNGNTCPGTNLGIITKVEIRAYAYGDGDDGIDLTPVFSGGDGDKHQTTPGVSAGWGAYQDITLDTNHPTFKNANIAGSYPIFDERWRFTIVTPLKAHTIDYVKLYLSMIGTPSGTLTVSIRLTDANHKPTGSDLASGTIATSSISTLGWYQINLTEYSLNADTEYCIICRLGTGEGDLNNNITWKEGEDATGMGTSIDYGSSWIFSAALSCSYDFEKMDWFWTDIQDIDCKVEKDTVAKGNQMNCAKVEVRVTYTPTAEGVTRSYGFVF